MLPEPCRTACRTVRARRRGLVRPGDDPSLLDAVRIGQERALAAAPGPDDRPHRAGELPDRGPEVQAQLRKRGRDRLRPGRSPRLVHAVEVTELEGDLGTGRARLVVHHREQERVEPCGDLGVPVEDRLDVLRVDVGAHDADRGVTPAVDPHEGQRDGVGPGQRAPGSGDLRQLPQPVEVEAVPGQDLLDAGVLDQSALIVDVVAHARREEVQPAHGAHQLALVVHLQEVDERVVLEHHREARVVPEQLGADIGPHAGEAPQRDADRRLAGHADLDVRGAVPGVDGLEPREQQVPQLLGHALAADQGVHPVLAPWEASRVAFVQQVLEERRITRDEEAVTGSQAPERREDLVEVRAGGLDDAVAHHPEAHVEPGGPGAHREGVDRDQGLGPERVAGEEPDVAVGDHPFSGATNPVVGHARRAAGLVDGRAGEGDPATHTALEHAEAIHVAPLVGLGELAQDPQREEGVGIDPGLLQEEAVRGHAVRRPPRGALRSQLPDRGQEPRRSHAEQGAQPAVAEAHRAEGDIEGQQPEAASHADDPRSQAEPAGACGAGVTVRDRGGHGSVLVRVQHGDHRPRTLRHDCGDPAAGHRPEPAAMLPRT